MGCCTNCDVQIMDMTKRGQERFLPNYREHTIELSNLSLMRVAVCLDCKDTLTHETAQSKKIADTILDRHKVWWTNNLPKKDPRMPDFHMDLSVEDANSSEEKFFPKVVALEKEKAKVREWQGEKADFEKQNKEKSKILGADGEKIVTPMPDELKDFETWKAKKYPVKIKAK